MALRCCCPGNLFHGSSCGLLASSNHCVDVSAISLFPPSRLFIGCVLHAFCHKVVVIEPASVLRRVVLTTEHPRSVDECTHVVNRRSTRFMTEARASREVEDSLTGLRKLAAPTPHLRAASPTGTTIGPCATPRSLFKFATWPRARRALDCGRHDLVAAVDTVGANLSLSSHPSAPAPLLTGAPFLWTTLHLRTAPPCTKCSPGAAGSRARGAFLCGWHDGIPARWGVKWTESA